MPTYTKTIEVEVEFDYVIEPADPSVGLTFPGVHVAIDKIEGVQGNYPDALHNKLCALVEDEILEGYLEGEE